MNETTDFRPAEATETIECPVCGSCDHQHLFNGGDYEYGLPGSFHVSRCRNCGLLMQNPRPSFSEILRYYTEKYEPFREMGSPLMKFLRQKFLTGPRIAKFARLVEEKGHRLKVLDVGCGSGDLLSELDRQGDFDCQGIEPAPHAVRIARERGLRIHEGLLETWDGPSDTFDLVIMNHVIEHLPNPMKVVQEVQRILKSGGVYYGETPCSNSIERMVFGRYCLTYHLPRHLFYFSPSLIARFLEQAGFTNIKVELQPQPSCWPGSFCNLLKKNGFPQSITRFFNGHNPVINMSMFPFTWFLSRLGFAPILHFSAIKK